MPADHNDTQRPTTVEHIDRTRSVNAVFMNRAKAGKLLDFLTDTAGRLQGSERTACHRAIALLARLDPATDLPVTQGWEMPTDAHTLRADTILISAMIGRRHVATVEEEVRFRIAGAFDATRDKVAFDDLTSIDFAPTSESDFMDRLTMIALSSGSYTRMHPALTMVKRVTTAFEELRAHPSFTGTVLCAPRRDDGDWVKETQVLAAGVMFTKHCVNSRAEHLPCATVSVSATQMSLEHLQANAPTQHEPDDDLVQAQLSLQALAQRGVKSFVAPTVGTQGRTGMDGEYGDNRMTLKTRREWAVAMVGIAQAAYDRQLGLGLARISTREDHAQSLERTRENGLGL